MVRCKRGQIWSYDLIIGSILFVLAMSLLAFFWWSATTNMYEDKEAIIQESLKVSGVLMSPGIPENWNTYVNLSNTSTWSAVQQMGLATSWSNPSISIDKVYKFINMSSANYSYVQNRIRSRYDFFIQFVSINNSMEQPVLMNNTAMVAGTPYNNMTVKAISKTERVFVYNSSITTMKLYLWSNSPYD